MLGDVEAIGAGMMGHVEGIGRRIGGTEAGVFEVVRSLGRQGGVGDLEGGGK